MQPRPGSPRDRSTDPSDRSADEQAVEAPRIWARRRDVIVVTTASLACEPSPVGRIEPPAVVHEVDVTAPDVTQHEALRIDQDLHPDESYEIVLDGWVRG